MFLNNPVKTQILFNKLRKLKLTTLYQYVMIYIKYSLWAQYTFSAIIFSITAFGQTDKIK